MKFYKIIVAGFVILFPMVLAHADDSFYPEADVTLKAGKAWTKVLFGKGSRTTVLFRAWYPYSPDQVWEVLTDTNSWKKIHKDYTDSATLDQSQFNKVKAKNPTHINDYYEQVGKTTTHPSDTNRKKGGVWTSYVFQRFNIPFPFKDRWCVIEITNDETKTKQGTYRYTYKMAAGNFRELEGYWEILALKDKPGWTEFRGKYNTDPGVSAPKFITRGVAKSSLQRSTQENMRVLQQTGAKHAN